MYQSAKDLHVENTLADHYATDHSIIIWKYVTYPSYNVHFPIIM